MKDRLIAKMRYKWNTCLLRLLYIAWLVKRNKGFECEAGRVCDYIYPYGFVPECGCPIHDPEEDSPQ